ncbi:DUF6397 family protein [Streptomyces sp. NPDC088554]|uniref:DUF6397 family protein n=1 Tax=Streptomyces sp. NPDC088554 TaxID=3365865 RepID=UPI003828D9A1
MSISGTQTRTRYEDRAQRETRTRDERRTRYEDRAPGQERGSESGPGQRPGPARAQGRTEPPSVGVNRAAQELELRRGEFELAAQLGHIRTTAGAVGGRRRVTQEEIDRLKSAEGFPDALRERVRTVGTAEGAKLMPVSPGRFTRLAKAGFFAPVRFYLNRYRVVVWLYLADELTEFADREPLLLTGRMPKALCAEADAGEDCRPRNWRGRRIGQLLHEREDPWERAAVVSCVLAPADLAELVPDPFERAYLARLRPDLAPGAPGSEAARAAMERLLTADNPDEIQWHLSSLGTLLTEARVVRRAPRPDAGVPRPAGSSGPPPGGGRKRLLARLWNRRGDDPGLGAGG